MSDMSRGAKSLSTTARGSAVTTVTNSLSAAHSSPGLVLIADPFPSSTLTCIDPQVHVARPPQFLPATTTSNSSLSEHFQQNISVYKELQPTVQEQGILQTVIGKPATRDTTITSPQVNVQRPRPSDNLIRQLLLRNLNILKLQQQKQQQQLIREQQQLVPQTTTVSGHQQQLVPQTTTVSGHQQQLVPQTTSVSGQQVLLTQKQDRVDLISPGLIVQQELPSQQDIAKLQQQESIKKQLLLLQSKLADRQYQKTLQQQVTRPFTSSSQGDTVTTQLKDSNLQLVRKLTQQKHLTSEGGVEVVLPMTGGKIEARDRPKGTAETMESRFHIDLPPFVNTCGDLPLSTDFIDASIYASSPNSLHIYEQEKIDMQCTMGASTSCTSLDAVSTGDDFDLKTQYEVSQDISSFPLSDISSGSSQNTISSMVPNTSEISVWSKPVRQDIYIKNESQDVSTPTLAELNMNVDLLDDIESYINFEMNVGTGSGAPIIETVVKQEPGHVLEKERSFDLLGQAGGSSSRVLSAVSVQYTPVLASNTVVKTEPVDMSGTCRKEYQKSFTPMTAVKPELIVPRAVSETKAPLSTIKEIDISDFATLQRLLKTEPLQARAGRKRTVSESQTSVKQISRKRSVGSAGLDSMELKWEEIKKFLDTEPQNIREQPAVPTVKRERTRYDSASSVMTLTSNEDDDSDSDKDFDDDSDSDLEGGHDIGSLSPSESLIGTKEKQYFWQYNVQSKGPKGTRVKFELEEDPHVLNDFEDPVFGSTNSENLSGIGVSIKHGGKARKGDGNDIVPSPKKLCQIGMQLRKINKQINDFVPVSELPSQARSKSRKEKNKLASRACRLKKKAQHEANKIKLHGLETEHRRLLTVIHLIRQKLYERLKKAQVDDKRSMSEILESLIKEHLGEMIAGHTTDFVNSVIRKVEAGDLTGGISLRATRSYPKELHN